MKQGGITISGKDKETFKKPKGIKDSRQEQECPKRNKKKTSKESNWVAKPN